MKTTIEVPDALFREAKSISAQRGIPLRVFVSEALQEKVSKSGGNDKPWMKAFGQLRSLHEETMRINQIIEQEFGHVEPEDLD